MLHSFMQNIWPCIFKLCLVSFIGNNLDYHCTRNSPFLSNHKWLNCWNTLCESIQYPAKKDYKSHNRLGTCNILWSIWNFRDWNVKVINFHQMVDIFKTTSNKWLDLVAICDVKNRNICHKTSTWNFKACTHKSHIQFTDETKVWSSPLLKKDVADYVLLRKFLIHVSQSAHVLLCEINPD